MWTQTWNNGGADCLLSLKDERFNVDSDSCGGLLGVSYFLWKEGSSKVAKVEQQINHW